MHLSRILSYILLSALLFHKLNQKSKSPACLIIIDIEPKLEKPPTCCTIITTFWNTLISKKGKRNKSGGVLGVPVCTRE